MSIFSKLTERFSADRPHPAVDGVARAPAALPAIELPPLPAHRPRRQPAATLPGVIAADLAIAYQSAPAGPAPVPSIDARLPVRAPDPPPAHFVRKPSPTSDI